MKNYERMKMSDKKEYALLDHYTDRLIIFTKELGERVNDRDQLSEVEKHGLYFAEQHIFGHIGYSKNKEKHCIQYIHENCSQSEAERFQKSFNIHKEEKKKQEFKDTKRIIIGGSLLIGAFGLVLLGINQYVKRNKADIIKPNTKEVPVQKDSLKNVKEAAPYTPQ